MKKSWQLSIVLAAIVCLAIVVSPLAYSQTPTPPQNPLQNSAVRDSVVETMEAPKTSPPKPNPNGAAQPSTPSPPPKNISVPVVFEGETLFTVEKPFGPHSPEERSREIVQKIEAIAKDLSVDINSLQALKEQGLTLIVAGDTTIASITEADAKAAKTTRDALSDRVLQQIESAIYKYRTRNLAGFSFNSVIYSAIATIVLLTILTIVGFVFPRIYTTIESWKYTRIPDIRIQNFQLVSAEQIADLTIAIFKTVRSILTLGLLLVYLPLVLSFFPQSRYLSDKFWSYLFSTIQFAGKSLLNYLPNLFSISVIVLIVVYLLQFLKTIFTEIEKGNISIPGFYQDWAVPTFRLLEVGILALSAVIIFPYLPGFGSPAFRGISVFLGVLLSIGSSAAIANTVAGVILIYTRAFQIGDRISVANIEGDVESKLLLVTRIRTPYNVIVTVPNALLLSTQIFNYNASLRDTNIPVTLSTKVHFRYDVPWEKIHEALLNSARLIPNILQDPAPAVFHNSLENSTIVYELRFCTKSPSRKAAMFSELHRNIQIQCNHAGIEILTPQYSAIRDGNALALPDEHKPKGYTQPGFQLHPLGNLFQIDLQLGSSGKNGRTTHPSEPSPSTHQSDSPSQNS
jgi:small-conductance mechanosensitive channel